MAASFFASLECELLKRTVLKTKFGAQTALFTYIDGWYNPKTTARINRNDGTERV